MTRTMYDSVDVSKIPRTAKMVAGYVNGRYKNYDILRAQFPDAICVPIATQASVNDGIVLDVERYDATPQQAPDWVQRRRALGFDPTVYTPFFQWSVVRQEFRKQSVPEPNYWVAKWDNSAVVLPGAVAKQYGGLAGYDLSIVEDYWPGVDDMTPNQSAAFDKLCQQVQAIHDAIYKGHPEYAQPGMEGTLTETWRKVTGK